MKTFDIRDPVTPEKHSLASVALSPLGLAIDIQVRRPWGKVGCMPEPLCAGNPASDS